MPQAPTITKSKRCVNRPTLWETLTRSAVQTKSRGSMDTFEKVASPIEKTKDDKRKEKKPGMLSGLFKRKDKKSKSHSEEEETDSPSKEASSSPKVSSDSTNQDSQGGPGARSPQRQTSKLQKTQAQKSQASTKRSSSRESQTPLTKINTSEQLAPVLAPIEASPSVSFEIPRSGELNSHDSVQPGRPGSTPATALGLEKVSSLDNRPLSPVEAKSRGGMFSPIRDVLRSSPSSSDPRPEKLKKAKERMPIDDIDSSPETEQPPITTLQHTAEADTRAHSAQDRLSESPVHVSPVVHPVNPPALEGDTSSQEEPSASSMSPSSTPELLEAPPEDSIRDEGTPVSTIQSARSLPTWSDASLRTYLEDDTDIRDLLVVVHDRTDFKAVGPDHPMVKSLCREESRKLDEISHRLDGLLQDLLARPSKTSAQ